MRRLNLRLGLLALLFAGASSAFHRPVAPGLVRPASGVVALVGGTVIDGTGAGARPACTVIIEGDRIMAVGEDVPVPEGAEVVDVTGHSIVPGLIDVHGHLYANLAGQMKTLLVPFARLYLAGGVTTVFSPGDEDPEETVEFREAQRAGEESGTRVYTAGPYFNHVDAGGIGGLTDGVSNAEEARELMLEWGGRIDGVKVYTDITPEEFAAVVEEADAFGLRVTGHLGSLTAGQAIDMGIDRLEHGLYAMSEFGRPRSDRPFDMEYMEGLASIDFESGAAAELIEKIVDKKIVLDPTIVILEALFDGPIELVEDWERYLAPQTAERLAVMEQVFEGMRRAAAEDPAAWDEVVDAVLDKQRELVRRVHEAGGMVVGGTDPVFVEVLPGYGMHREAEHFVMAGMTELEAIQACTGNAALALGLEDDLGTVAPGKLADLVVVEGDPSKDDHRPRQHEDGLPGRRSLRSGGAAGVGGGDDRVAPGAARAQDLTSLVGRGLPQLLEPVQDDIHRRSLLVGVVPDHDEALAVRGDVVVGESRRLAEGEGALRAPASGLPVVAPLVQVDVDGHQAVGLSRK